MTTANIYCGHLENKYLILLKQGLFSKWLLNLHSRRYFESFSQLYLATRMCTTIRIKWFLLLVIFYNFLNDYYIIPVDNKVYSERNKSRDLRWNIIKKSKYDRPLLPKFVDFKLHPKKLESSQIFYHRLFFTKSDFDYSSPFWYTTDFVNENRIVYQ